MIRLRYALLIFAVLCSTIFLQSIPLFEKIDRQAVFVKEYGREAFFGEYIKPQTSVDQKVMVYSWDTLVYVSSQRDSGYPYAMYLPVMMRQEKYQQAHSKMIENSAPAFYYYECDGTNMQDIAAPSDNYERALENTCLFKKM